MTGLRPAMGWLHSRAGLLLGWLLYVIFVTGSCGYYRNEITQWMTPELAPLAGLHIDQGAAARRAVDWLSDHAATSKRWTIQLPDERHPALRVEWQGKAGADHQILDPRNGKPLNPAPRETRGGEFLYRLHSDLHFIPAIAGRFVVGLAGLWALVILFSGVMTHRHILKNLFRFRPNKGWRSWLDAHNMLGILALPFHVSILYSGLTILMILMMPWGILSAYAGKGLGSFVQEAFSRPEIGRNKRASGPLAIETIVAKARRQWQDGVSEIAIERPSDPEAILSVNHQVRGTLAMRKPALSFDRVGRQIGKANDPLPPAARLHNQIFGFHVAHFAGPAIRLILFFLGLAGAAMVATGMVLWSKKRRHPRRMEIGNVSIIAGLPLAISAYFCASFLPAAIPARADLQIDLFFWTWAAAFLCAVMLGSKRSWPIIFFASGMLFLAAAAAASLSTDLQRPISAGLAMLGLTFLLGASRSGITPKL